jgi:hypothetical protein
MLQIALKNILWGLMPAFHELHASACKPFGGV